MGVSAHASVNSGPGRGAAGSVAMAGGRARASAGRNAGDSADAGVEHGAAQMAFVSLMLDLMRGPVQGPVLGPVLGLLRGLMRWFGTTFGCAVGLRVTLAMALLVGLGTGAQAHEVVPTIAQLSTTGLASTSEPNAETTAKPTAKPIAKPIADNTGQDSAGAKAGTPVARLELRLNAESFLAEIDLDGLTDTNSSTKSADYDALRALGPDTLSAMIRKDWPRISEGFVLTADGSPVVLTLTEVEVSEIGNVELARPSRLVLTGPLAPETRQMVVSWPKGHGTLVLRQTGVEDGYAGYLEGGDVSPPLNPLGGAGQTALSAFVDYIPVGFDHILPKGLDHILFVLGLFFLSPFLRPLLWQISAFTLAHTVTLALGALGWVVVPASVVEPLIAASIAFVAIENILSSKLHRWRPAVVFGFGLLHGLGFASVLQEFGLPQAQFIPALIGFNVGVELGQLTVIAAAFLAVGAWFRNRDWYRSWISIPASVVIALVGIYWVIERTLL